MLRLLTGRPALVCSAVLLLAVNPLRAEEPVSPANWPAPPYWTLPAAPARTEAATHDEIPAKESRTGLAGAATPLPFVALAPCRLIDTRSTSGFAGSYGPPSMPGGHLQRIFSITGQCGIPADAQAVSFNFTVWAPVTRGDIRVFPFGGATPSVATLNWEANIQALANAAIVPLGTGGAVTVQVDGPGTIDLIADVNGYYSPLGVVNSVNSISGAVTIATASNMSITPSGQTLTISGGGTLTGLTVGGGLSGGGSAGIVNVTLPPSGVTADRIASAQVVKSLNSVRDDVTIAGTGTVSVSTAGGTITIGAPPGSMVLGAPGDTTLIGAGYTEVAPSRVDYWAATATAGAPSARGYHTAVWTGTKMIVWGGFVGSSDVNTGGQYDPGTDSWTPTGTGLNCPGARINHTAVWTGSKMIVWGGNFATVLNDGGQYDPGSGLWTATSTGANCPTARTLHAAVWTGSQMIVWGGTNFSVPLNDGGLYDPGANSWSAISVPAPAPRSSFSAVWTGSKMLVWGGTGISPSLNDGGQYDPGANSWAFMNTSGAPTARSGHSAVWTGTRMIVWGGGAGSGPFSDGGRYDPGADSWTTTTTAGAPAARSDHRAVWTGSRMIVWGGTGISSSLNDGGQYDPGADAWSATTTVGAPSPRNQHTVVWTGSRMIVWGGIGGVVLNSGGQWTTVSLYLKN